MSGARYEQDENLRKLPFQEYVRRYIIGQPDFMAGVRRGLDDRRDGKVEPWPKVKGEFE